jgi:hypothetical protein
VGPTGGNDVSHSAQSATTGATSTGTAGSPPASGNQGAAGGNGSAHTGDSQPSSPTTAGGSQVEVAAKSAEGADDSLLLAALVLGFTFAVSGVVVAAGMRGGRRAR